MNNKIIKNVHENHCPKCREQTLEFGKFKLEDGFAIRTYKCLNCSTIGQEVRELSFLGFTIENNKTFPVINGECAIDSIKEIPNKSMMGNVEINKLIINDVEKIGDMAFFGCRNLKEVYLSDDIKEIKNGAFEGCVELEKINLPNIEAINKSTFSNNVKLKELFIPSSVIYIGKHALGGCGFKTLVIPNSVKELDNYALSGCDDLEEITLPNNIKLGKKVFRYCERLTKVYVDDVCYDVRYNNELENIERV